MSFASQLMMAIIILGTLCAATIGILVYLIGRQQKHLDLITGRENGSWSA